MYSGSWGEWESVLLLLALHGVKVLPSNPRLNLNPEIANLGAQTESSLGIVFLPLVGTASRAAVPCSLHQGEVEPPVVFLLLLAAQALLLAAQALLLAAQALLLVLFSLMGLNGP